MFEHHVPASTSNKRTRSKVAVAEQVDVIRTDKNTVCGCQIVFWNAVKVATQSVEFTSELNWHSHFDFPSVEDHNETVSWLFKPHGTTPIRNDVTGATHKRFGKRHGRVVDLNQRQEKMPYSIN